MLRSSVDLLDDVSLESFCDECLMRSFCNHIYFGQWHLADGYFTAHQQLNTRHLTDIPTLFRRMIEYPYGASLGSKSVPTPHHLSWLCVQQPYSATTCDKSDVGSELQRLVELRLLLLELSEQISLKLLKVSTLPDASINQVCADLYSASTADSLPSEETVSLLAEVLYELPDLGDALLRAVGLIHLRLEIHIACLHRSVDELSDAINVSTCERTDTGQHAAAARFYRLLALFDVPAKEAAEKRAELHRLWLRVANLLSSGTSTLDRSMVLSCLLAEKSQSTCRWFIKLLNAADLHHLISRNVPVQISSMYSHATTPSYTVPASSTIIEQTLAIDNNMGSAKDGEKVVDDSGFIRSTIDKTAVLHNLPSSISNDIVCMFALSSTACHRAAWHHLYLMCVERRIHFLDLFLEGFIHLVEQQQFDTVEQLLKCSWLKPLRHLMVLMCWDFCETPKDAQRLVSCATSIADTCDDDAVIPLSAAVRRLSQQAELAAWFTDSFHDVLPSGRRWQNGLELFHGLELCSALEMLLRSHCVTELEPELVVAALDNCPAFANNGKDGLLDSINISELVSRRSLESVSADQPSSVDIYRGFCALYNVMSYIVDSRSSATNSGFCTLATEVNRSGQVLPSKLTSAGRHISGIVLLVFRLEIMEDMFSLLFSRVEHLQDSEDSPDRQTDSEPEDCDKEVVDQKHQEFVFDAAGPNAHFENIPSVLDTAATTHEISSAENPQVGALMVESRCSPLEVSSSSLDGRSDELSGSQTVSTGSVQCGDESGFLVQDHVIRDVLLLLQSCCEELSSVIAAELVSVPQDKQTAKLQLSVLRSRVEALKEHVSDAQWRLRIAAAPSARISPVSEHHHLKQRRQRSRRHRDSVTFKDTDTYPVTSDHTHRENSVVPNMLCRPESLLNLCLTEGRIADAEEVVKVCQLSGTEASFMSQYCATMSVVRQSGCGTHHGGLHSNSEPSIKDLARHMTAGSSSNAVDIVDRFLSSTRLPSFDAISSGGRSKVQVDSCQLAALVTFDLAVGSRAMPEVSQELLLTAQGKLNSTDTKRCPQTCTNLKSFIDDMIKLLNVVIAGESAHVDLHEDSLASLLASSVLPLEADDYRIAVDGLIWIDKAINQTRDALLQHSLHPAATCSCSCSPDELLAHLVDMCRTALPRGGLLPVMQRSATEAVIHWDYTDVMLKHLNLLSSLVSSCANTQKTTAVVNYRPVELVQFLRRSPSKWLSELVLDWRIPPGRLDDVAGQLNVDLVAAITNAICPTADCYLQSNTAQQRYSSRAKANKGRIQLNCGPVSSARTLDTSCPEFLVRYLLTRLIHVLQGGCRQNSSLTSDDIQTLAMSHCLDTVLCDTAVLRDVDLHQLTTDDERLCFYGNLLNLMIVHAFIVCCTAKLLQTMPDCLSDGGCGWWKAVFSLAADPLSGAVNWLLHRDVDVAVMESVMSYRIESLGVVSIFELKYFVMRHSIPQCPLTLDGLVQQRCHSIDDEDPWSVFTCPTQPLLTFSVVSPGSLVPPVQVLSPELVQHSLRHTAACFLTSTVTVDVKTNEVVIPQLLYEFASSFLLAAGTRHASHCEAAVAVLKQLMPNWESVTDQLTTVKITSLEKFPLLNFEWTVKPHSSVSLSSGSLSTLTAALLDPGISQPLSSSRIVRRKFRVGHRVLAYLQSHSMVLATVCGLLSCRRNRPTPAKGSSQEAPTERCTVYCNKTFRKNVQHNGCTFVREFDMLCERAVVRESPLGSNLSGMSTAGVDENLRDYIFRKLKHQLPTLKRFLIHFLSPLMPGADEPSADPFWLLCSREIPDELCSVFPSMFANKHFNYSVYRRTSQLLQVHSLQSAGFDKFLSEPNRCSVEEILRLFEVVPSSVVQNSILWATLHDFVIISAVQGGSLSLGHALRVCDPDTRCRLLMSTTAQVDPSDRSSFSDMLKSCLTDSECPALKQVAEKRIITEKLHSEYLMQSDSTGVFSDSSTSAALLQSSYGSDLLGREEMIGSKESGAVDMFCGQQKYSLAHQWIDSCHLSSQLHSKVEEMQISDMLKSEDILENVQAFQMLEAMKCRSESSCLESCDQLLSSASPNQIIFVSNFVLSHLRHLLPLQRVNELRARLIGYKAVLQMPVEVQSELCRQNLVPCFPHSRRSIVAEHPLVLLEQLLMNEKLDCAEIVLRTIREAAAAADASADVAVRLSDCDKLVEKYAKLAFDFSAADHCNEPGSLSRGLARLSAVQDTKVVRARSVLTQCDPATTPSSALSPVNLPASETPPKFGRSMSTSSLLVPAGPKSITLSPESSAASSTLHSVESSPSALFRMPPRAPDQKDWTPDESSLCCEECQALFSLFNRRHHCRRCGRLLCGTCCSQLLEISGQLEKACKQCHRETTKPRDNEEMKRIMTLRRRLRGESVTDTSLLSPPSLAALLLAGNSSADTESSAGGEPDTEWTYLLTTDDQLNQSIRKEFYYDHAPSSSLALSILRLHSDDQRCGHVILKLVQQLSVRLKATISDIAIDHSLLVQMLYCLLMEAKLKFANDDSEGSVICHEYLDRLKIIRLLLSNNCPFVPSIDELKMPAVRSAIRQSLISSCKFEAALLVCNKYQLDRAGVYASWGLSELSRGGQEHFELAKDKFKHYYQLHPPLRKNDLKEDQILGKILDVLTNNTSSKVLTELSSLKSQLFSSSSNLTAFLSVVPNLQTDVDADRYKQCIDYLSRYGSHYQHILFVKKWRGLRDAVITFKQMKDTTADVLLHAVIYSCLEVGSLSKFTVALKSVDPTLESFRRELTAAGDYFMNKKMYNVAYVFQDLLQDDLQAGTTCIYNLYLSAASSYQLLEHNADYLDKAKKHYRRCSDSVSHHSTTANGSHISPLRELVKISWQEQLMRTVHRHVDKLSECLSAVSVGDIRPVNTVPTMFAGQRSQTLAVQLMVMLEYVTSKALTRETCEIIKEFDLDAFHVMYAAGVYLICHLPTAVFREGYLPTMQELVGAQRMSDRQEEMCELFARTLASRGGAAEQDIEFFVQNITPVHKKLEIYSLAGMYDKVFVFAAQTDDADAIRSVMHRSANERLRKRCEVWLNARQQQKHASHHGDGTL